MDRRLALAAAIAIPVLAGLFHLLSLGSLRVLTSYLIGLSVYWALLALALARTRGQWSLAWRWPSFSLFLVVALGLVGVFALALPDIIRLSAHVLLVVACAAIINGTLEEAFWRGALIPDLHQWDLRAIAPMVLFVAWHLAPAAALAQLDVTGGVAGFLLGAALIAPVMMALRLSSATAGVAAVTHVLVNLGVFAMLAAKNHGAV